MATDTIIHGRPVSAWSKLSDKQIIQQPKIDKVRKDEIRAAQAVWEQELEAESTGPTTEAPAPAAEPPAAPAPDAASAAPETPAPAVAPPADPAAPTPAEPTAPPAQADAPADVDPPAAARPVTLDDVLRELPATVAIGFSPHRPTPVLTPAQSKLQNRMYAVLNARGVRLRSQGDVYGWLLDQVAASLPNA